MNGGSLERAARLGGPLGQFATQSGSSPSTRKVTLIRPKALSPSVAFVRGYQITFYDFHKDVEIRCIEDSLELGFGKPAGRDGGHGRAFDLQRGVVIEPAVLDSNENNPASLVVSGLSSGRCCPMPNERSLAHGA